ncbi:MAG: hypothetical protein QXS54_02060 [Candidatus Methanomethylicaceae archaeon]
MPLLHDSCQTDRGDCISDRSTADVHREQWWRVSKEHRHRIGAIDDGIVLHRNAWFNNDCIRLGNGILLHDGTGAGHVADFRECNDALGVDGISLHYYLRQRF